MPLRTYRYILLNIEDIEETHLRLYIYLYILYAIILYNSSMLDSTGIRIIEWGKGVEGARELEAAFCAQLRSTLPL